MYEMMKRFAQVVETGSVTAAANILCVSQPAVTKSLKQLEDHFSVELLIRGKKGVAPTEHGETVYRLAKLMQQSMSDVAREIGIKRAREGKQLRIGAGLLWCYVYLPDALNSVIDQDPELGVEVVLRPPEELHNMVSDGRLDLAVGEMPEERHCGIVYENLLVSKNSIFAHHSHPLRSKSTITDKDLKQCHWIVFSFTGRKTVAATHDPSDYNQTKLSNLFLACLLLQKGNHIMRIPSQLAPLVKQFGCEPIEYKSSENEFESGIFYSELALLKSAPHDMITAIRNLTINI